MKPSHKLFFAIPFDSATRGLYERISEKIRTCHPSVATIIGNREVGPSPAHSDIASFKAQNRELTRQFVTQIREADIVIADLTHNNPNVHVELGIALTQNKNILRVTGRSPSELGFDIRNLEIVRYENERQLAEKIEEYLSMFLKIKELPISREQGALYYALPAPLKLDAPHTGEFNLQLGSPPRFVVRDGAIRVNFEIHHAKSSEDWFGVFFRADVSPFMGSHLVYVRQDGRVEVAVYPDLPRVIEKSPAANPLSGKQELTLQFENDWLAVQVGNVQFETGKLSHPEAGGVWFGTCNANAEVHSAEMVCRDTIEWL